MQEPNPMRNVIVNAAPYALAIQTIHGPSGTDTAPYLTTALPN